MKLSGQPYIPTALLRAKGHRAPIWKEAAWTAEPAWTQYGKENNPFMAPAGNPTPVVQPVD
jgi:hypothetical protein